MKMTSPREATDELLAAARAEAPSATGKAATLEALTRGEAVAPPFADLARPPSANAWRWVGGALAGMALLVAAWVFWPGGGSSETVQTIEQIDEVPLPAPRAAPAFLESPEAPGRPDTPGTSDTSDTPGTPETPETPATPAPEARPPKRRAPPPALEEEEDGLARELALLDRARGAVLMDPKIALATLDQHQESFPRGALVQEAQLVRVEALLRLGRRSEAEGLARKMTARDPSGLLSQRVTRLLSQIDPP